MEGEGDDGKDKGINAVGVSRGGSDLPEVRQRVRQSRHRTVGRFSAFISFRPFASGGCVGVSSVPAGVGTSSTLWTARPECCIFHVINKRPHECCVGAWKKFVFSLTGHESPPNDDGRLLPRRIRAPRWPLVGHVKIKRFGLDIYQVLVRGGRRTLMAIT